MLREELQKRAMIGFCLMYPAAGILEGIGRDWDWIWIDGQHGELDYRDILEAVRVCNLINRPCVVRVPGHSFDSIGKYLDMGIDGIMVPMVNSAEQARMIVQAAKFPPLGMRSYGGRRPIDMLGRKYANRNESQPMLICQIETHQGFDNAEEIIAVDGVDMLFFGPDDMAMQDDLDMAKPRPDGYFDEKMKTIAQLAQKYNKFAGSVFVKPNDVKRAIEIGYRLIVSAADITLLGPSSKKISSEIKAVISESNDSCSNSKEKSKEKSSGLY